MRKLWDHVAGFSRYSQELDPQVLSRTLESQRVRVHQSHRALALVAVAGSVYIYGLWDDVRPQWLVTWIALVVLLAVVRVEVCRRVERSLVNATVPILFRNERNLFVSSLLSAATVGSGYWWVGLQGTDQAVFAVTLMTLIYAIGTTINSSIHYAGFPLMLVANVGQGIVFLLLFRSPADLEVAVAMIAILILLVQFGKRNAEVFGESIRIRDENREQNAKLESDKLIIEKALNVARKANEEKNRFMAAASHDLRQPLHAMTLFLGSLRHMAPEGQMRELIDKIDETSMILHEQFNSLLDLSKFDAGVVAADQADFRLDLLLKNIADAASQEAQQKQIALHLYTTPVTIRSDMLLMERMLRNLVMNAVRYTEQGSVSIQTRELPHGLVVSVIDTGVGIAEDEQARIFSDYYQVSNKVRSKNKGSGLGLAIVKRIAALLEMPISLTSTSGAGSTFSVTIPSRLVLDTTVADAKADRRPEMAEDVSLEQRRVLIVDDDSAILHAMEGLLRTWGCHAVGAASPDQVERLLKHDPHVDLVLMDDMLHDDMSGLELALELTSVVPRERIIMATGNVNSARLATIREEGFEVLVKPVDHQVLRQALMNALRAD